MSDYSVQFDHSQVDPKEPLLFEPPRQEHLRIDTMSSPSTPEMSTGEDRVMSFYTDAAEYARAAGRPVSAAILSGSGTLYRYLEEIRAAIATEFQLIDESYALMTLLTDGVSLQGNWAIAGVGLGIAQSTANFGINLLESPFVLSAMAVDSEIDFVDALCQMGMMIRDDVVRGSKAFWWMMNGDRKDYFTARAVGGAITDAGLNMTALFYGASGVSKLLERMGNVIARDVVMSSSALQVSSSGVLSIATAGVDEVGIVQLVGNVTQAAGQTGVGLGIALSGEPTRVHPEKKPVVSEIDFADEAIGVDEQGVAPRPWQHWNHPQVENIPRPVLAPSQSLLPTKSIIASWPILALGGLGIALTVRKEGVVSCLPWKSGLYHEFPSGILGDLFEMPGAWETEDYNDFPRGVDQWIDEPGDFADREISEVNGGQGYWLASRGVGPGKRGRSPANPQQRSDKREGAITILQEASALYPGLPLTIERYEALRSTHNAANPKHAWPSYATLASAITGNPGNWSGALKQAGVESGKRGRPPKRK